MKASGKEAWVDSSFLPQKLFGIPGISLGKKRAFADQNKMVPEPH
jgi:hypothetical protein